MQVKDIIMGFEFSYEIVTVEFIFSYLSKYLLNLHLEDSVLGSPWQHRELTATEP